MVALTDLRLGAGGTPRLLGGWIRASIWKTTHEEVSQAIARGQHQDHSQAKLANTRFEVARRQHQGHSLALAAVSAAEERRILGLREARARSGNGVAPVADHGEAKQQRQRQRPGSSPQGHRHGHPEPQIRLRHKKILGHDDGVPGGEAGGRASEDDEGVGAGEAADERGEAAAADQGGEGGPAVGGGACRAVTVGGGAARAAVQGGGARRAVGRHRPGHPGDAAGARAAAAGGGPRRGVPRPRAVPLGGGAPGRRRARLRRRRLRRLRRIQLRLQAPGHLLVLLTGLPDER